jgi:hypothetical protein
LKETSSLFSETFFQTFFPKGKTSAMKHLLIACVLALNSAAFTHAGPALEPYTYTEDFESGAVGPWASYPPSQDTAYDPSIRVLPLLSEKNAANRALYREITPNFEIEYEFGVRKLLDMYLDNASELSFRARIRSYRGSKGVRVRFGFADSTMTERLIPLEANTPWRDCRIPLSGILKPGERKQLSALAIMAVCPDADPETVLRFGIDDVRINGSRARHFVFSAPAVHKLTEWPDFIAGRHFIEGGSITIEGTAPVGTQRVIIRIAHALTGEDEKTFPMTRSGDHWICTIPLDGGKGPGAGFWRATLSGEAPEGADFSTGMVFLVRRKDAPSGHPSLYFSQSDIGRIMAKTGGGHGKTVWEAIRSRAGESRSRYTVDDFRYKFDAFNEEHWIPVFADFGRELRNPQDYIRDNALVYGLSGDIDAGDAARKAFLKVAEWPAYVPPHITNQGKHSYYITGLYLTDLAFAYDLLYDRFSPEEREKAADALYSKGMKEAYEEYVRGNWVSSNTSNWICDVTAGSILCAAAVYSDYGDEALEPFLTGSILKVGKLVRAAFDPDGDYGEGSLYYMHTLHGLTKSMAVLERFFAVRFPDAIARSHTSLLYQIDPGSKRIYSFGDAYENLMLFSPNSYLGMGNAVWLLAKYRDPHLKWLYDMNPGTTERDLIFLDESLPAKPPADLPKAKHFREVGTTVFRSGFSRDDFVFIFRCGAYINHQHFDQGAFFLADRGEEFLGEVGRTDYYADDWYQNLVIQPGGHNCILVNGNPESQRHGDILHDVPAWKDRASTTDFFTFEDGAFVSGRLDPLYRDKLTSLRRSVLYLEPRTVVLIDEAGGTSGARTIDLRFHAPFMEDISPYGKDFRVTRPGGTLNVRTISPNFLHSEVLRRPMTLREIGDRDLRNLKKRGFLQLTAALENSTHTAVVVNVFSTDRDVMERLNNQSLADHAVFTCHGRQFTVNTSGGKRYRTGDTETDALVFSIRQDGFLALRMKEVTAKGAWAVRTDKPVSLLWETGGITSFTYAAHESVYMTVSGMRKPKQVIRDGKQIKEWTYSAGGDLAIILPAGESRIEIR